LLVTTVIILDTNLNNKRVLVTKIITIVNKKIIIGLQNLAHQILAIKGISLQIAH